MKRKRRTRRCALSRQDAEIASRELEGELAKLTDQNASLNEDMERIGAQAKLLREEVARLTELNDALTIRVQVG